MNEINEHNEIIKAAERGDAIGQFSFWLANVNTTLTHPSQTPSNRAKQISSSIWHSSLFLLITPGVLL